MKIFVQKNPYNKRGLSFMGVSQAAKLIGKAKVTVHGYLDGSRPSKVVERLFKKHRITVVKV